MIDSLVDYLLVLFYVDGWIEDKIPRNVHHFFDSREPR